MEAAVLGTAYSPFSPDDRTLRVDLVAGSITVVGELDRGRCHLITDATTALTATLHRSWVLDATGVTFCDAGGLRAIAAAAGAARRRGGSLTIVGAGRPLRRLLTLVGMDDLLADGTSPGEPVRQGAGAPAGRGTAVPDVRDDRRDDGRAEAGDAQPPAGNCVLPFPPQREAAAFRVESSRGSARPAARSSTGRAAGH
jgi:anti-anti-sigma factor